MNRATLVFVVIAYVFSIALSLVVGLTGGHSSPIAGLGFLSMFFPAIAVLIVRFTMGEKVSSMGLNRFPVRHLPFVLLMPAVLHTVMLPSTPRETVSD